MRKVLVIFLSVYMVACSGEGGNDASAREESREASVTEWDRIKQSAAPALFITTEFEEPAPLSIATMGWEDGLNISRDGLHLYATYIPVDFLSFVLNNDTVENLQHYDRGPHYGMDLVTNPTNGSYPWYHSDIIYATRATKDDPFSAWMLSTMQRSLFSEGALSAVFDGNGVIDILAFTSNEESVALNNIKVIRDTNANPIGEGTFVTDTDSLSTTTINTRYVEDNPHIERMDPSYLVLFFDSEDRPNGTGMHDIWFAESWDNGGSWTTPTNVSSINTASKEHQPHLFYDGDDWWLYFSAYHSDNKLAIFRSKQLVAGDWNSWGVSELVMGAGNTAGIGEPTLTDTGDLCFVVVYENNHGSRYDRYDSDPWCALGKGI